MCFSLKHIPLTLVFGNEKAEQLLDMCLRKIENVIIRQYHISRTPFMLNFSRVYFGSID